MNLVYVRIILYVLSPLLTALAAAFPGWGITYVDGVFSINVETLAVATVAALGLSGALFAKFGVK